MNEVISSANYMRAYELDRNIKMHAELMQKSLYEVCKGLKEMRDDKLYKEIGYENFNDYCENEVGLTRRQTYNFIAIAEGLTENFVESIQQIGTTKLTLLAKLDEAERTNVLENTDIENTTVKQLKQQIEEMRQNQNKDTESHQCELAKLHRQIDELVEESATRTELLEDKVNRIYELEEMVDQKAVYIDGLVEQLENAKRELKEREAQPIDLTYTEADTKETEDLRNRISALEQELEAERRNIKEVPDTKGLYMVLLNNARQTIGELNRFMDNDALIPIERKSKVKSMLDMIVKEIIRISAV